MKARTLLPLGLPLVALFLGSCGGSDDVDPAAFAVQQDLDLDPTGFTTVVDFAGIAPLFGPGNIESNGGQTAQVVMLDAGDDTRLFVEWDERVTPSHEVRVTGVDGVDEGFVSVTTTDASAPTFAIDDAQQGAGLGADTIEVSFSGPNVVPLDVVLGGNWSLVYGATTIGLDASSLDFDESTQVLTITTDAGANVHADFELAVSGVTSVADVPVDTAPVSGSATGDLVAPTLVSAVQNLNEDEFGRIVEFTFSEAMDPVFSTGPINFSLGFPVFASEVVQTAPETLRVRFDDPVVPGIASVQFIGVIDAHGNAYVGGDVSPSVGTTVANDFAVDPVLRSVEGIGGDQLVVVTTQALAPERAALADAWRLEVDGTPVDLVDDDLTYELELKTLTVDLPDDYLNGLSFLVEAAALTDGGAPELVDVDGESFTSTFTGTVDGDGVAPGIELVLQNRNLDPSGSTFDLQFSEDLEEESVEVDAVFTVNDGPALSAVSLTSDPSLVRVVLAGAGLPGEVNFDVSGVRDPAGNTMDPATTVQASSTDDEPPLATGVSAIGYEGPDNDRLTVTFDDDMWQADIEDALKWSVESPPGSAVSTNFASASYDAASRTATLEFTGGGFSFQAEQDVQVDFVVVRDIAGNAYAGGPIADTPDVEVEFPIIESVWVGDSPNEDQVTVRFDEQVAAYDDAFTRYELVDAGGSVIGTPSGIAVTPDGRGVVLTFGQVVQPGVNTLNVVGPTDLAGNSLFPEIQHPIDSEDTAVLDFDAIATDVQSVSGEANDEISVVFDRVPSSFGLLDPANWTLVTEPGGLPLSLDGASFDYDGDRTVVVTLDSGASASFLTGADYRIGFTGLTTAQGIQGPGPVELVVTADGDMLAPNVVAGRAQLDPQDANAILVDLTEAIDFVGLDPGDWRLEGVPALNVQAVGPRTARATFTATPVLSDTLDVSLTDLAGILGLASEALGAIDSSGPLVGAGHAAVSVSGFGGDHLLIPFQEPVQPVDALDIELYSVSFDGQPVSLSGAVLRYSSIANTVRIDLPSGTEIPSGGSVSVTVQDVRDHAGNAMASPSTVLPPVQGDVQPPSIVQAFVNQRVDATGATVDVAFSEDVAASVAQPSSWSVTGGGSVQAATMLGDAAVRLVLSAPLGAGDSLSTDLVPDAAQNLSGPLSIDPVD